MRVDDFDFDLPEELIALRPAKPRHASRLLHVGALLVDRMFTDLPSVLQPGDALVINNTKVLPAALKGVRPARTEGGGGEVMVELNLHKALPPGPELQVRWQAFARPAKRLQPGDSLQFAGPLAATVTAREGAEVTLEFDLGQEDFDKALREAGSIPLPPYIGRKREVDEQDRKDYQTVYAKEQGSVAAPTAGLHFTDEIFAALKTRGVSIEEVTLHVGAGTFLPVSVDDTDDHKMHAEWGEITQDTADRLNAARAAGGRIVSVGTTSLRLLESSVGQGGEILPFADETDIFITPGFKFRAVDALITNFHLPRSTLFMLVSAFSGTARMQTAYAHAVAEKYRFYSYGDACYLERHDGD